jgi:hypothetical protein
MRLVLLIATAVWILAFSIPPSAIFDGRVLSTAKVSDVSFHTNSAGALERVVSASSINQGSKDKGSHLEIWKAEVKVEQKGSGPNTNLPDRVVIYYNQDSSTNFVTPYGVDAGRPPRLRLNTNTVYTFFCGRSDIPAGETNAFFALDERIKPK